MPFFEAITFIGSGFGAGLLTGFTGASAAIVAAPILITVLGLAPYTALGLSLATDVVASSTAAGMYYRHKNVDLRKALFVLFFAIIGVVLGSLISIQFPPETFGLIIGLNTIIAGGAVISTRRARRQMLNINHSWIKSIAAIAGFGLGLNAGIFGTGGGIMIFLVLTIILGYAAHRAIGTSVLVMVLIALFGAITHYIAAPFSLPAFGLIALGGALGAWFSATMAHKLSEHALTLVAGGIVIALGILLTTEKAITLLGISI